MRCGLPSALVASALLGGCARLPAGRIDAVGLGSPATAGRVYLVRGFLDWYSTGVDTLAAEVRSAGVPAAAYREEQWSDLADALLARPSPDGPLVLIGFSYGADDVIHIARRLAGHRRRVALLVLIDPVTPAGIPANVDRCVSFRQTNGAWDLLPFLRGVPVHADEGAIEPMNIDVRARPDLVEPNTSHATIAANENVHRAIVALVRRTCLPPIAANPRRPSGVRSTTAVAR